MSGVIAVSSCDPSPPKPTFPGFLSFKAQVLAIVSRRGNKFEARRLQSALATVEALPARSQRRTLEIGSRALRPQEAFDASRSLGLARRAVGHRIRRPVRGEHAIRQAPARRR